MDIVLLLTLSNFVTNLTFPAYIYLFKVEMETPEECIKSAFKIPEKRD